MADYILKFVDNRPVLKLSAQGPQGPTGPTGPTGAASTVAGPIGPQGPQGLQNVFVQSTAPVSPNLYDIWFEV